jgi:hypothetical protein
MAGSLASLITAVMIDAEGFAIVKAPVRILRMPSGERRHLMPRVLAALLSADGGAGPAGRSALGEWKITA